jgi:indolepyruvate ferredoxin oxidoreductase beta subunit
MAAILAARPAANGQAPAAAATAAPRPLTILICALGGEGGGVLCEWLVESALHAGLPVQSTSIPGVAQRTGATTYYVEIFPVPLARLGGRKPVLSLLPVPGALDVLVSSELLETARQIGHGMTTPERTQVISSSSRTLTTQERMQLGDGRLQSAALVEVLRSHSREHHLLDMAELTREAGTVVSAVMFGALAGGGALPWPRETCEAVIRAGGKGVDASLRGFARAHEIVSSGRERAAFLQQVLSGAATVPVHAPLPLDAAVVAAAPASPAAVSMAESVAPTPTPTPTPAPAPARELAAEVAQRFPAAIHDILALGHARMLDYQDADYASLYLDRMARVVDAERAAPIAGAEPWAASRETARWLALWMAFDDIVRVADLKCRATRRERVEREVKVQEGELLRVYEHFKPGVPELAALLPAPWAQRLTRWDRRRQARGREPFALPLKIATHGVFGFAALRLLASLRWLRRRGTRYAEEQLLIERWLAAVESGLRLDAGLGHEIALCGRLIKGYGSTNERGKANLLHVVDHLAQAVIVGPPAARAAAVRAARIAALADEGGTALDRTLQQHGAPQRPVPESPIRFVRRAKAAS